MKTNKTNEFASYFFCLGNDFKLTRGRKYWACISEHTHENVATSFSSLARRKYWKVESPTFFTVPENPCQNISDDELEHRRMIKESGEMKSLAC